MTNIRSSIFITENTQQIERKILNALKKDVNKYLEKAFNKCKTRIVDLITKAIINSPEYNSLIYGDLKYEFGLPDSKSRLDNILAFWQKITANYNALTIQNNKFSGGFSISMIDSSYADVLSSSASTFRTEKGTDLNWLEWLLLFGNKTIIRDYVVEFGPNPNSRTGMAVMKGVQRGKWSVPGEFVGTKNNNWITRAIESVDNDINTLFKEALK